MSASARALAAGDALGALRLVALRDDPPALALRGIAMARLGEHARARELLRRAARGFGAHEAVAQARCIVAEAEVALAMRDLAGSPRALAVATATLDAHGDRANALQARLVAARRMLLLGRLQEAADLLARVDDSPVALSPSTRLRTGSSKGTRDQAGLRQAQPERMGTQPERKEINALPPPLHAVAQLANAELAMRRIQAAAAQAALARADAAARLAGIPALVAEVRAARAVLDQPVARGLFAHGERVLSLADVATLLEGTHLVVDACRHGVRMGEQWVPLARRPVLFALAHAMGRAWPHEARRDALIATAFRMRHPDETHRARLRVEIGRLRALVRPLAAVEATAAGFILRPAGDRPLAVLEPPIAGDDASVLALLADGAPWSTSALALALGTGQRTVQRALAGLHAAGRVRAVGDARARRWLAAPLAGFATTLLLPGPPSGA